MSGGRHSSNEEFEFDFELVRNIVILLVVLVLIAGVVFGTYKMVTKMKQAKTEQTSAEVEAPQKEKETSFDVLGTIKIAKIGVEQPILDSVEEKALKEGVIKLYGGALNEDGNFCIAGHNYDKMFKRLEELKIGDELEILNLDKQSTSYKVTEIASSEPTDLSLLRKEEGKTQITLITCEKYSTKRLIVKAEIQK